MARRSKVKRPRRRGKRRLSAKQRARRSLLWKLFAGLVILGGILLVYLDALVSTTFSDRRWEVAAKVFARPLELYPGLPMDIDSVDYELELLGYRDVGAVSGPGQKSRSGYSAKRGFEGGQMPLHRRLPKRGFTNIFRKHYRTLNVDRLNGLDAGTEVTPKSLQDAGLLPKGDTPVKILGNGDLQVALTVKAHKFTKTAARKIEAAGGKAEILG